MLRRWKAGYMTMLIDGDYSIMYRRTKNEITIYLPPTIETLNNTLDLPVDRRVNIPDGDLLLLLRVAKLICSKELDDAKQL